MSDDKCTQPGRLRKFRVTGHVTISVSTLVQASSKKEALALAEEECATQTFCNQCSNDDDGVWTVGGELDGEVVVDDAEVE